MPNIKHIVIIAPPETSILNVAGPLEVFAKTSDHIRECKSALAAFSYQTHVVSITETNIVHTSAGLPIVCEGGLESINYPVDTLLIAGNTRAPQKKDLLAWLRNHYRQIRRVGSICAGAFILAEAGLLAGKRATSHWRVCDQLARDFPDICVEKDPIYIKDGSIYTSAGISTGMDLSLALVEEDYGREIAVMVARVLVLYLKRPGNQSQFSNLLMLQQIDYEPIQLALNWITDHLEEDLGVELLAEKASMSPRNFARVFVKETGLTPAKYIEKIRLETARRRLEETRLTIDEISNECGIGNGDGLRRLFLRHMRTTPSDYRKSFSSAIS